MGIGGDSGSAGAGGQLPARSGDGASTGGTTPVAGAAGRQGGKTGRHMQTGNTGAGKAGNKAAQAAGSGSAGKAGTMAKVAKSGTVGASGVVSSSQAAGTGTRETVRPLPVRRRVRGGTVAAAEGRADPAITVPAPDDPSEPLPGAGDTAAPSGGAGSSQAPGPVVTAANGSTADADFDRDPEEPARSQIPSPSTGLPGQTRTSLDQPFVETGQSGTGTPAPALGLARVWLPAATQALALATRLAEAAAEASESAGELKYRADLLRDLLTGRLDDPDRLPPNGLATLLQRNVTVVVAEPDPLPDDNAATLRRHQDALAAAWAAAVRAADPEAVVSGYPGEVVALITVPQGTGARGTANAAREAAARVRTACARIRRTFTTGISRPVRGIEELPAAYDQARRAVAAGRRLQGPGAVTDFDRLGVFRLLSLLPVDGELERFAAEVLGPLAEPQDAESGELRRTLQVLLETNLNVAETSRRLYVHYNTLRYRIGKLERLVGPFTQDSRLRLDLMIALEIVHLTEGPPLPP